MRRFLNFIKWLYIGLSEIIGLAGMPDDATKWGCALTPYLEFFDIWEVRAFLVLSGLGVLSYSSWKPHVVTAYRKVVRREAFVGNDDWTMVADAVEYIVSEYESYRILGSEEQSKLRAFQDLHELMCTGDVRVRGSLTKSSKKSIQIPLKLCRKLKPVIAESAIGSVYNLMDPNPDPPATKTEGPYEKGEVRWQGQGIYDDLSVSRQDIWRYWPKRAEHLVQIGSQDNNIPKKGKLRNG